MTEGTSRTVRVAAVRLARSGPRMMTRALALVAGVAAFALPAAAQRGGGRPPDRVVHGLCDAANDKACAPAVRRLSETSLREPGKSTGRSPILDARGKKILAAALAADGRRIVVSLGERRLWVLDGADTLKAAEVAIGMDEPLVYGGRKWTFHTPRGVRQVRAKHTAATWRPPDWAYAEVAREHRLKLRTLPRRGVRLADGTRLAVRGGVVGLVDAKGFAELPVDEHIVFDSTLFIPPLGTLNRRIDGELGAYQLDIGEGYLLHGTRDESTIGTATTHGCLRLRKDDLEWLHENIPVGTKVYLY